MSGKGHHMVANSTTCMPHKELEELGLSPNEAKIYHALLVYGGAGVSTISIRAHVHRRNAYDALQRLLKKGLVFESYGQKETVFEAVEPNKLLELIREKELRLSSIMPSLQQMFQKHRPPELAYIFNGPEGVKNYLSEVLKTGKDMYILGAEGAWFDPLIAEHTAWFLREAKKKNIKIHAILDDDAKDIPQTEVLFAYQHKFLPPAYDTHATMDIFGDYIVSYTGTSPGKLRENATIFVIYSPELAESYRTWWRLIWDLLPREKPRKKRR